MTTTQILSSTNYQFPGQKAVYHGKVRDVYDMGNTLLFITTDRYSAFDRSLALIPNKGALLTAITKWWFEQTKDIVKNHIIEYPDANVIWCKKYKVLPLEVVVRGYITGVTNTSLWHTYNKGQRDYGEFILPDGLRKNYKLPQPVLTPTTKFETHDRNLTPEEAVAEGLIDSKVWQDVKKIALKLFTFGQEITSKKGLILVDTKYEFGIDENNNIILIDEIHTPDSSRYWLESSYKERVDNNLEPENYDKEFLRLWFKNKFDPYNDKTAPKVPKDITQELERRYKLVYKKLSDKVFIPPRRHNINIDIEQNILKVLQK